MAIEWKASYTVLIKELDDQHKKLFEIGKRLYTIASDLQWESKLNIVNSLVEELKDYAIYHFDYEEQIMLQYGYSQIEKHKMQHQEFIQHIKKFYFDKIEKNQKDDVLEMIIFIIDWISKHIMILDKQYSKDFVAKGFIL